ncbi:hypothetical protein [Alicyclobacillus sp. ALC3]|uniref:hypothetical protein n=1 Tax=Alicyclobacillus sp. ALC3 TaxID=2796143 RepID=UPI002378D117|nr:hypothetical protein [Alicyclobacillus sp. ALC3]WDL99063.1 hypothetical protein JC200_10650 [Alicyclobacillus sp. ALC3]
MASEDNNPLKPLQHTGLPPDDKAKLRSQLIDLMQAEEAGTRSRTTGHRRGKRRTSRLPGLLAGAAAVVVAGVIVANSVHQSHASSSPNVGLTSSTATTTSSTTSSASGGQETSTTRSSASVPHTNSNSTAADNSSLASNATPMEVMGIAGGLESRQGWPLNGASPQNTGSPMFAAQYSSSGFTIGGVHWTWPTSDTNPSHYIVVPTTVNGKPFLVWSHLGAQKHLGNPNGGFPNAIEPTAASSLYMTPWSTSGGSLAAGAQLITGNIPPLFSTSGQYVFPSNPQDTSPASLASSAWTGWFQWGAAPAVHLPVVNPSASPAPTMAWPSSLFPAYNGVVLAVESQMLLANQGNATNLYYINLATHHIVGLGSLTNGGGLFYSMRVVSGMVFTGAASDLTGNGSTITAAYIYNEATGQRLSIPSNPTVSTTNGFANWTIHGGKVYDTNNKLVADLQVPAAAIDEPSAATFGVSP